MRAFKFPEAHYTVQLVSPTLLSVVFKSLWDLLRISLLLIYLLQCKHALKARKIL
jgi:hypothetical protein